MAYHDVWAGPKVPRRTSVTENLRFLSFLQNEYAREREVISSITANHEVQDPIKDKKILFRTSFQCQIVSSSSSSETVSSSDTHVWYPPSESKDATCPICLERYRPGELVCFPKKRKCCHIFHQDCMEGWMLMNPCCPLCRVDLMTASRGKPRGKTELQ